MKGDPKLLETLNALLADELTAISQYMVHAEMAEAWGYAKLHESFEKRAMDEMRHAETLIGRIFFLEGNPTVSKLNPMAIGTDVPTQLASDHSSELAAIKSYNDAIVLAGEVRDFTTRQILEKILSEEDRHIDQLEELQDQIQQMTLQLFLTTQVA